eukprot:CAMPEP_0180226798 /NCGR_PEP_ID=MMETSP0987-20121128/23708_1 /TAXON_ID=697907 /ORGANISM="non described non described, Strain CCMP2293" /LENGTH=262 /DNA_ID=CAMNT_0022190521 /DNA_START=73 /DNA_END=857 /DNA_ORIENTATION=-
MTRWDAALLALLMLRHLCSASQPACEGEGEGECQRNLYDQVYTGDMYSERIVVGTREVGLMTNVLLCPALWGDREASEPLSVLDAGAGRGIMVDWLRQGRAPRAVEGVGIELSGVAVDSSPWPELKRNGTLVQGSLDAIPWPDRHFDLVWSHEVLEHIPAAQMPTVAREIARVTSRAARARGGTRSGPTRAASRTSTSWGSCGEGSRGGTRMRGARLRSRGSLLTRAVTAKRWRAPRWLRCGTGRRTGSVRARTGGGRSTSG